MAKILFHAKRGIQELNYDAMKEIKVLQLDLNEDLRFILPSDYVNWVRISYYKDGALLPLTENIQTGWATSYLQDNDSKILFDQNGNVLKPQDSELDISFHAGTKSDSSIVKSNGGRVLSITATGKDLNLASLVINYRLVW